MKVEGGERLVLMTLLSHQKNSGVYVEVTWRWIT